MTAEIQINFIEGRRGSICNNSAYSAVHIEPGQPPKLLDIIPADELDDNQRGGLRSAFEHAINKTDDVEEVRTIARKILGLDRPSCRPC